MSDEVLKSILYICAATIVGFLGGLFWCIVMARP